jgi:hypothetical protein
LVLFAIRIKIKWPPQVTLPECLGQWRCLTNLQSLDLSVSSMPCRRCSAAHVVVVDLIFPDTMFSTDAAFSSRLGLSTKSVSYLIIFFSRNKSVDRTCPISCLLWEPVQDFSSIVCSMSQ